MKLLFFTDAHIRGDSPKSRIDDYPTALENKFNVIGKIIQEKNIDVVLNGGDLFHTPAPAYTVTNRFLKILKSWNVPIYSIHGSHDKFGYNDNTIQRTALGIAEATGILQIIDDPIEIEPGGIIVGIHHSYELDKDLKNYSVKKPTGCKYLIQIVHGMLVPKPFISECTLISQVNTEADLCISGHYHPGFAPQTINNTAFVNPGSLGRVDCSQRVYLPSVLIIDTETQEITQEVVCDSTNVFYEPEDQSMDSANMEEFIQLLHERIDGIEIYDVKKLIVSIAEQEKVVPKIIQTALKYIE